MVSATAETRTDVPFGICSQLFFNDAGRETYACTVMQYLRYGHLNVVLVVPLVFFPLRKVYIAEASTFSPNAKCVVTTS